MMEAGTKIRVEPISVFESVENTCFKIGTDSWANYVKQHKVWAGKTLTVVGKVGWNFVVEENNLIWRDWMFDTFPYGDIIDYGVCFDCGKHL